ncbi:MULTISPECIES: polyhydroxyalkanoic acid system family protein [Pseudomonas]|jgi:putative polyhydroxyalkanoate system protein|uniref:Polyhydroxyalkanoic acid system family protein n=1 Tax=Pseudomonas emilianonis TaxID=2915812 RepID=A0ABT0EDI3_9PSED|nr:MULTISPECIES: polyhydroxyalkanoic acid system family protein [Pseudomonas]MCK1783757.1 polyhydroxyalkanoic acid system family protein [Pseudomonas emilianonis]MCP1510127.1 putative polyhydroxyalkanoate system protein [Pseudomonas marginalis]MCP1521785.1 putative polyhydroxyalkanoate system protein [Pseudomonas marginalis]MDQ0502251.1 putative polyhydroxyalkanoate system protein [Pseudomonas marginalis]WET11063.1 polyhydroxyalkanoic acid system family protein [Pseudomonas sp. D3]
MARITVERAHSLGKEGARAKAEKLAQKLQDQYGLQPSWSGDTLNLKRSGVKGTVLVADDLLRIDVELGLLMSAMSGTIKTEIEKALDKALA